MNPDDALTIEDVVVTTSKRPRGSALLVVGITKSIYMRESSGYRVVTTEAPSAH